MRNHLIRTVSFLLLIVMLLGAVACAQTPSESETPSAGTTVPVGDGSDAGEAETTAVNAENILGTRDFGGAHLLQP